MTINNHHPIYNEACDRLNAEQDEEYKTQEHRGTQIDWNTAGIAVLWREVCRLNQRLADLEGRHD